MDFRKLKQFQQLVASGTEEDLAVARDLAEELGQEKLRYEVGLWQFVAAVNRDLRERRVTRYHDAYANLVLEGPEVHVRRGQSFDECYVSVVQPGRAYDDHRYVFSVVKESAEGRAPFGSVTWRVTDAVLGNVVTNAYDERAVNDALRYSLR